MEENDDFAYQVSNQSHIDYSLITQERTAKLELLTHLLNNSTRAVVLCGSKGIGKTTLLNVFQQQRNESWQYCLVQGSADLSFEQIENQLIATSTQIETDLAHFFERLAMQNKKIVLMIDNAGRLAPYLSTTIIDYAAQYPVLKLVFVLSHDDLAIKTRSDSVIEDGHIIEIPPLSEQQCGDFLQHLAIRTTLQIPVHGITDSMIASLYQQTHGIPARIIAQLPILTHSQKNKKTRWLLLILLFGLCVTWTVLVGLPMLSL